MNKQITPDALTGQTDDPNVEVAAALEHYGRGDPASALRHLRRAVERWPTLAGPRRAYAVVAKDFGALNVAAHHFAKISRLTNDPSDFFSLADVYLALRLPMECEATLLKALEVDDSHLESRLLLARLYGGTGRIESAMTLLGSLDGELRETAEGICERLTLWGQVQNDIQDAVGALKYLKSANVLVAEKPLTACECEGIIRLNQCSGRFTGLVGPGQVRPHIRRSEICWLSHSQIDITTLRQLYAASLGAAQVFGRLSVDEMQPFQLTTYSDDELGHYDWHQDDDQRSEGSIRRVSMTVQLSPPESYDGGDLEFRINDQITAAPRHQGLITVFESRLFHRVTPVTRGRRHSLVCWARGPVGEKATALTILQ